MILVDKNIKALSAEGKLIKEAYTEENVNSISYDLTLGSFADKTETEKKLIPGATVIIKTKEELCIPDNITGRVGEKNSLLRMGLKVDGPQYQPGHTTYAFLRVQNISADEITLKVGMHIAQIYFEELKEQPEKTYAEQKNASFQNEDEYRHFGKYEEEYRKNIKSFEKMQDIKENIESASHRIYGNVLTLMGIIVAIFSLISINSRIFDGQTISPSYIIAMNLSLTFCIAVMLGMILFLINKGKGKAFAIIYGIVLLVLGVAAVVFCLKF